MCMGFVSKFLMSFYPWFTSLVKSKIYCDSDKKKKKTNLYNKQSDRTKLMCVYTPPKKSLKDFTVYPCKWHPNRFASRGGLGIHPNGCWQLLLWLLLCLYTHEIPTFFIRCIYIRLLFILFPMIKMCYFVSRSCTGLKIFRRIIFFPPDFLTRNPPPYKTVRLYLSAENEPVGYNIMCTQRIKHISKRRIIHCYIVIGSYNNSFRSYYIITSISRKSDFIYYILYPTNGDWSSFRLHKC